jgi:hypothetical protein
MFHLLEAIHLLSSLTQVCVVHLYIMCKEPKMIAINSNLTISCLLSGSELHAQLFLLLMETIVYAPRPERTYYMTEARFAFEHVSILSIQTLVSWKVTLQ